MATANGRGQRGRQRHESSLPSAKGGGPVRASGTLSNQLCLRTWLLQPPYAVICDHRAHIHRHEAGGVAYHSGAAVELIQPSNGAYLRWVDIEPQIALDDGDVHAAPTKIVSLENTLQGTILPQDEILTIRKGLDELRAQGHDIKLHIDGARLWNVSAATGKSMKELCEPFDSVSLCFSKGLGAPIGSMMLGPQALIRKAHHFRKLFGAGMRQSGFIAAAARVALTSHFHKLAYTHELARWTANALEQLGVRITMPVDTNMVFIDTTPLGFDARTLVERAQAERGIKLGGARLVVHHQIVPETMSDLVQIVAQLKAENEGVKLESKGKSDGYPSMATRK
ncbi:hypothetical protein L7F22_065888 [Adiantum nelumboides]|nr:hypothetical protein [Adiantum nelumboides]